MIVNGYIDIKYFVKLTHDDWFDVIALELFCKHRFISRLKYLFSSSGYLIKILGQIPSAVVSVVVRFCGKQKKRSFRRLE